MKVSEWYVSPEQVRRRMDMWSLTIMDLRSHMSEEDLQKGVAIKDKDIAPVTDHYELSVW